MPGSSTGAQGRLGVSRLGHVGLGRGAFHGSFGEGRAGSGIREQLDTENFFESPLSQAIAEGEVPKARLDDMARRILTSIFAHGLADQAASEPVDLAASDRTALAIAREGTVLLRNQGLLPLPADTQRILGDRRPC